MGRFEETGIVPSALAAEIGLVGPAARASGLARDVRIDHPSGLYLLASLPMSVVGSGDVYARARVRWLEVTRSIAFVGELLDSLPAGPIRTSLPALDPNRTVVTLVEGWRGEIAHVVRTDDEGSVSAYKVVDPSFHNWMGLALALRDQAISDFPLCNKSFNLSYCGHDL
jgi:Ni,Fe-hydrogenase III large subunit